MNNEHRQLRKEAFFTYMKVKTRRLPQITGENHEEVTESEARTSKTPTWIVNHSNVTSDGAQN